jgi:hypothetical protein
VLIDLTDAVAEELRQPVAALSVEMVYRGLYHFTQAQQRGEADDVVAYLAAEAKGLGILKRKRRSPKDAFLVTVHTWEERISGRSRCRRTQRAETFLKGI